MYSPMRRNTVSPFLSVIFFASFFFCCLSLFLHPKKTIFVERACVLVFHCIGEYITLDLFYLVNLASICSLSPKKYMF